MVTAHGGGAGGDPFRFDLPCRSFVWPQLTFNSQQAPKSHSGVLSLRNTYIHTHTQPFYLFSEILVENARFSLTDFQSTPDAT